MRSVVCTVAAAAALGFAASAHGAGFESFPSVDHSGFSMETPTALTSVEEFTPKTTPVEAATIPTPGTGVLALGAGVMAMRRRRRSD